MDHPKAPSSGLIKQAGKETGPEFTINSKRSSQRASTPEQIDACSLETESSFLSEGSCPPSPVYFEMVQPPYHACADRAVVIVFGEDEVVEFEFVNPQASLSKAAVSEKKDLGESDTLDGQHLPNFFSYTREEREMIRKSGGSSGKEVQIRNKQAVQGADLSQSSVS